MERSLRLDSTDKPALSHPGFLALAGKVLIAPGEACDHIAQRRRSAVVPMLLLIALFALLWGYYYLHVDFPWLIKAMIEGAISRPSSGSTRQGMEQMFKGITPALMFAVTMVSGGLSILIIVTLRAFYMAVVARIVCASPPPFFNWLALSMWASVPTALSILMSLIYVLTNDASNMMPSDISLASANSLIFQLPDSSPWAAMSNSFDVLLLWSFFVMGIGFSRWTGVSIGFGQAVVLSPFVLLYGLWALAIVF
jgi:Yip1 domain